MKPGDALIRDARAGVWLHFTRPRRVLVARAPAQALALLDVVEGAARDGLWAAGFVSYEAAPAFDAALVTRPAEDDFPAGWFALYDAPERIETIDEAMASDAPAFDGTPTLSAGAYRERLERVKELIAAGDTYQVNFTYRLRADFPADPFAFFARLARAQRAPYAGYVDTGDWTVCSASPELFFALDGDRIETRPMKGTAARGMTLEDDRDQARRLRESEKERAENVMIVDMARNDLGRVAASGSVRVDRLFDIEKYPTVWQMVSTVSATTGAGLADLFRALFPAASVTGAPKARTMEIIADLESAPRRLYTGALGFHAPGRRAQFNVAIRTLLIDNRTRRAEYGVGGGIVWDSEVDREARECGAKALVLRRAAPQFRLLETLRWTPVEGYYLLDRHLRRIADSAEYFDYPCDPEVLRDALDALAARLSREPRKVRLLLAEDGAVATEDHPLPANPDAPPLPPLLPLAREPVDPADPFLYHKTTHRAPYDAALEGRPGFTDALLHNPAGEVTESTIANVAVEIDGMLYTPPVRCGLLGGTLRAELLAQGRLRERPISVEEALRSPRVLLMNAVRGLYVVRIGAPGDLG